MTLLSRARVSPYYYFIVTMSVSLTVLASNNAVTLKYALGVVQGY